MHNSRVFGTSMNGVSIYQDGARDIGEINGGVVGMITPEVAFPPYIIAPPAGTTSIFSICSTGIKSKSKDLLSIPF